jgi:hypothetical protein
MRPTESEAEDAGQALDVGALRGDLIDRRARFVAIDGRGGSGKSTFAHQLADGWLKAFAVEMDDFYRPSADRRMRIASAPSNPGWPSWSTCPHAVFFGKRRGAALSSLQAPCKRVGADVSACTIRRALGRSLTAAPSTTAGRGLRWRRVRPFPPHRRGIPRFRTTCAHLRTGSSLRGPRRDSHRRLPDPPPRRSRRRVCRGL